MSHGNECFNSAIFRFYGSLNDFLPKKLRQRSILYHFKSNPNMKDAIEAIGIPHPEVQLILVEQNPVSLNSRLKNNCRVSVFPFFEKINIQPVELANTAPYKYLRFILDVHLGKLAKFLRFAGFDSLIFPNMNDNDIADLGAREERIVLTRDLGLLKHKKIQYGYWLRSQIPEEQFKEVAIHFQIKKSDLYPWQRCSICNGKIKAVEKRLIYKKLEFMTNKHYKDFFQCENCGHVYWKGSHFDKMQNRLNEAMNAVSYELKRNA